MNKEKTIDELARLVAEGFADTATKLDLAELRTEMQEGFSGIKVTLNRIENRLTHIDDTLIADHAVRIKHLEETASLNRL